MVINNRRGTQRIRIGIGKVNRLMNAGITNPREIAVLIKEPSADVKKWIEIIEKAKRNKTK